VQCGIYKIEAPSGGIYIGQSKNIPNRLGRHFALLRRGAHKNFKLQGAYDKYGDELKCATVLVCARDGLNTYEQTCIDTLCPRYNISQVAHSPAADPAIAKKIGDARRGKANPPEAIERMRVTKTGTRIPAEVKIKMSEAQKARWANVDVASSAIRSARIKASWDDPVRRAGRLDAMRKADTEGARARKISKTTKGKKKAPFTDAHKAALSLAARNRWGKTNG
jgi:group I intron endonuclease